MVRLFALHQIKRHAPLSFEGSKMEKEKYYRNLQNNRIPVKS